MKRIIGIILIIAGIITFSLGAISFYNIKTNTASSIAIIGGADGPTSIFISGKLGATIIVGIVVLVIVLLLVLLKKERPKYN